MSRIRKIVILVSLVNLFIFQSINVLADNQIASDSFTHEEIMDSLEDDPKDMTLVEELRKDLDETTYIEIRIYEKENSGLTKAGYKTKLGTYTYRVKDKKTGTTLIKYVLTGKFRYNGKTCSCTEALGKTTHLVKNRYSVQNDSAVVSGDTAIGYFYCTNIKTKKKFGGTFKIRISKNGTIFYP